MGTPTGMSYTQTRNTVVGPHHTYLIAISNVNIPEQYTLITPPVSLFKSDTYMTHALIYLDLLPVVTTNGTIPPFSLYILTAST